MVFLNKQFRLFLILSRKIGTINPNRVSVFGYGHVPWDKKTPKINQRQTPDNERQIEILPACFHYFLSNGYEAFGIDHYAKKTSFYN
jgi:oxygen-independent coproporphyrinogen-3 oxidase